MRPVNRQFTFPEEVPLTQWQEGTIRVIGSRVTLDTIIGRMQVGDTPEEIHEGFPTVTLAQINRIIEWYLNNQIEADEYLKERYIEGERLRKEIQSQPKYIAFREKLLRCREQRLKT